MADVVPKDAPSRARQIMAVAILCSSLATIFVVLRVYTRLRIIRLVAWDDYVAVITLSFCILYSLCLGISTRYGMGLHTWDVPDGLEEQLQMWIFIAGCFYVPSLLGYKMSILFLYLRIFHIDKVFRYCTWIVMFITFGYLFSNLWIQIFSCRPIVKYWRPDTPGHCINWVKGFYALGSLNIITDMMIFVLPLPMVWRLQLSLKEKIGVSTIFLLGSVNWAVAIIRFAYIIEHFYTNDPAWHATDTFFWNMIEINTGLICACIPTLKPFFRQLTVKSIIRRSWSLGRKASENEDVLKDGRDYSHSLYIQLEHNGSSGQATPNNISLGQLDLERALSGVEA